MNNKTKTVAKLAIVGGVIGFFFLHPISMLIISRPAPGNIHGIAQGLETGVWTSPLIKEVILKEFGVVYHVSQVRRILNRLGFTVQYPRIRLSKADAEKQKTWVRETLPAIKKRSQKKTGF